MSTILIITTIFEYWDFKHFIAQIEVESILAEYMFNGWIVALSFLLIALYEFIIKNKPFKIFIRIFLTLILIGKLNCNNIPVTDFCSGVENTAIFSGVIAVILLIILGLQKIYLITINKNRNASC